MVSVPFRGSCSEIKYPNIYSRIDIIVSVPFRGSCSEMST